VNGRRALYMDLHAHQMEVQRAATRLDPHLLGLTMALLLLTAAAGLLYLSQASTVAQLRYCLADNEREQAALLEQIALLRCEVAASQSFGSLEQRVEELGLVDAPPDEPVMMCYVEPAPFGGDGPAGSQAGPGASWNPLDRLRSLLASGPRLRAEQLGMP
jgi:hypothetical protein